MLARSDMGGRELHQAIQKRLGVSVERVLAVRVAEAVARLLADQVAASEAEVLARLRQGPGDDEVVEALTAAVSIGETYFFRSPAQLERLGHEVTKRLIAPRRPLRHARRLRVWSAACSTGEEAYSLAILFKRAAPEFDVRVVGTDMNEHSLEVARQGEYRGRAFRGVRPVTLQPWLVPGSRPHTWAVSADLRRLVSFQKHNLVADVGAHPDLKGFDVVVCRNVLIYVEPADSAQVVRDVCARTGPNGLLVVSPAEYSAARHADGFRHLSAGLLAREAAPPAKPVSRPSPLPLPLALARPLRKAVVDPRPPQGLESLDGLLQEARRAANAGDLDLAQRQLTQLISRAPDHALAFYHLGELAFARHDAADAVQHYRRAAFLQRDFVAAELGLGLSLARLQRTEAVAQLELVLSALASRPDQALVEPLEQTVTFVRRLVAHTLELARGREAHGA